MLRTWSPLAAQPGSANALRLQRGEPNEANRNSRSLAALERRPKSGNSIWRPEFDTKVQRRKRLKWTEVPGKVRVSPGPQNASGTRACPDLGAESATRDTARRLGEWLHPSIKVLQVKS